MKFKFWLLATISALSLNVAAVISSGKTSQGRGFISGGIGEDERAQIDSLKNGYNLSLVTAMPSGEYLAAATVVIHNSKGRVLNTVMTGPWLLVDLAPGAYQVTAYFGGEKQAKLVTIPQTGRQTLHFYFSEEL